MPRYFKQKTAVSATEEAAKRQAAVGWIAKSAGISVFGPNASATTMKFFFALCRMRSALDRAAVPCG